MTNTPERSQVIAEMEQKLEGITPGAWTAEDWPGHGWTVCWHADAPICHMRWTDGLRPEVKKQVGADAELIAAAPRLLRAALALLRKDEEEVTEAREAFKEMHDAACVESGKAEAAEAKLTEAHAEIARLTKELADIAGHLSSCGVSGGVIANGVKRLAKEHQQMQQSVLVHLDDKSEALKSLQHAREENAKLREALTEAVRVARNYSRLFPGGTWRGRLTKWESALLTDHPKAKNNDAKE